MVAYMIAKLRKTRLVVTNHYLIFQKYGILPKKVSKPRGVGECCFTKEVG